MLKDHELSEEEADAIIMAARAHWFEDDDVETVDVTLSDDSESTEGEAAPDVVPGG